MLKNSIISRNSIPASRDQIRVLIIFSYRKCCFRSTGAFEMGLSDYHLLIFLMLETMFQKDDSQRKYIIGNIEIFNEKWFGMCLK